VTLEQTLAATRGAAALFDMRDRGLIEVRGGDRVRWLDGMISGDVPALEAEGSGSGCYATLLTNRGAIIADLHVARWDETFWLECARGAVARVRETLERYVIADDVELSDRSDDHFVLGLEGPEAATILAAAAGEHAAPPAADRWAAVRIGDCEVVVGAFGWSGEPAFQLRLAPDDRATVEAALDASAPGGVLVRGDRDALEVLRVEAGIPALGAELDEDVLPPEARLERAVSTTKGCYVGQEIVARLRSRGQVNHLLVGFRLDVPAAGGAPPAVGTRVSVGGRPTGELTSVVRSPGEGWIALGYVRREHAEPGTRVELESARAEVAALPFVAPAAASPPGNASGAGPGAEPAAP
jgi:folate-binding protein YgfZ